MEKKQTIGNVTAGFMIALAITFDLLQGLFTLLVFLIPLAWFVTFSSLIIFFLWFALCGVRYGGGDGGRKLLTMFAMGIAELAPLINALPAITAGVIGIIVQTRIEDARRNTGKKVTPRTAMAAARQMKIQAARTQRANASADSRETAQQARHAPRAANDNTPSAANDNTFDSYGRESA